VHNISSNVVFEDPRRSSRTISQVLAVEYQVLALVLAPSLPIFVLILKA